MEKRAYLPFAAFRVVSVPPGVERHPRPFRETENGSKIQPAGSASHSEKSLLAEIGRLGGEERLRGAEGALEVFQTSLSELVHERPKAYGAGNDPESQSRIVFQLIESVRVSFLLRTVEDLRHRAGYVLVCGRWIHRAVFTFISFGLLAAVALPVCAVSLTSTSPWGWLPGALGIATAVLIGGGSLSRVRCK